MQRVWSALFVPAVVGTGLGTAAVAIALAQPTGRWWFVVTAVLVGIAILTSFLALVGRPQLGTTD
jgi:hypothetical protein